MEEMLSKGVVGHELSNEKPLVAVAAIANQIRNPLVPQLSNAPSFVGELLRIGPGELGEFLDGDPTAVVVLVLEAALVDDIGGFLTALGDDEVGAEVVGGSSQVGERELRESRRASGGVRAVGGVIVLSLLVLVGMVLGVGVRSPQGRCATAHNSVELTQCAASASCSLIIIER